MRRVRYLTQRRGKWRWTPGPDARALGFSPVELRARTRIEAETEAEEHNRRLDAERHRMRQPQHKRTDTLSALIENYLASVDFKELAARTRADYRRTLDDIRVKAGSRVVAEITTAECSKMYRALRQARGEAMAANIMRIFRALLSFGRREGWRADNPAQGLRIATQKARTEVWAPADVDAVIAAAQRLGMASVALAIHIGYDSAQRLGDILALTWSEWDGSAIILRQGKTDAGVAVPLSEATNRALAAMKRTGVQIVISESTKKPYRVDQFGKAFAAARALAELPMTLQFRDLRRTAATEAAAGGATVHELQAMTGHKGTKILERYVRPQKEGAQAAQRKRETARRKNNP